MKISLPHVRVMGIILGITVVFLFLMMGGSLSTPCIIQIDFSMYPEEFEGLDVQIDGEIVGKLQKYGQRSVSGFEVNKGIHFVRIVSPELECPPQKVTVDDGEKIRFILDFGSYVDDRGRTQTIIALMR